MDPKRRKNRNPNLLESIFPVAKHVVETIFDFDILNRINYWKKILTKSVVGHRMNNCWVHSLYCINCSYDLSSLGSLH